MTAPGRAESAWGTLEILSADKSAGHASGFDLVLLDEAGLLRERDRPLVDGLLSSVSARNGILPMVDGAHRYRRLPARSARTQAEVRAVVDDAQRDRRIVDRA